MQGINVLEWPPQSPDLNPIEMVWAHLKYQLDKHQITLKAMMRNVIQDVWLNISQSYLSKLIESMPACIKAVMKNKGGATKY